MKKMFYPSLVLALLTLFAGQLYGQSVTLTLTQAPCNANGILTANFSGLTPPLTVDWGNGTAIHTGVTGSSDILTGYTGSRMAVLVTDVNNQSAYTVFTGAPPFTFNVTTTGAVCPAPGTATVTISGGTSPFTYQWTTIPGNTLAGTSNPASLAAGNYDVMITDANGCVYGTKYVLDSQGKTVNIPNSSSVNFTFNTTPAGCTNGTATATGFTGGVSPYSVLWSNGAVSNTISGLTQGQYSAKVTDAAGCYTTKIVNVTQSVNISVNTTPTAATCTQANGAATAFGSGGAPPYAYLWNTSATTQGISGLQPGIYSVKVTDANGCFGNGYAYVNTSTPVNTTYSAVASSCTSATGSATLNITGGTTPYTVQWYTFPAQTGVTASNLAAGTYSYKVTDAAGCVRTGTVVVPPVNQMTGNITATNTSCTANNGTASIIVAGGTTPYSYLWSTMATTSSVNGLAGGSYTVKVTDAIGCSISKTTIINISSPVTVNLTATPASCLFSSDGTLAATPAGGTGPYSYQWSNAATTPAISGLAKGYYNVMVSDVNGCKGKAVTMLGYNPANNSCYCTITGTVFHDLNNNCVKDAGEPGIQNIQVHCSNNIGYAYTDANGVYTFRVPSGSYTISETVLGTYPLATCQSNNVSVNATAGTNCTHTVNFANTVNPIHDMLIQTWDIDPPVPGYPYKQRIIIKNEGTVTESAVAAGYKSDAQISSPVFTPSTLFTGTWPQYNIGGTSLSLAPGFTQVFTVVYNTPTNIPLNTVLSYKDTTAYTSPISNWLNDYSPWNNVKNHPTVVVGSFDPNFKEVHPQGEGAEGKINYNDSVLEYMVHFQNLGTYKAQNIYILDSLDSDLDWTTMKPVYQSHPCSITMNENGVIRFQFDNINLPSAQFDEPASHGMVTYMVKTKKGLPLGTQFRNSAAIYFDFNEPVITNTTVNTLSQVAISELKRQSGNVKIYPNPTAGMFTLKVITGQYSRLKITNALGQVYWTGELDGNEIQMNLSGAQPGVYFAILSGVTGTTVEKIEKL